MVLDFPLRKDKFQLNNKSFGDIIEVEYTETCTSFNNERCLYALSKQVRSEYDTGYFDFKNNVNVKFKTNQFGIRTMKKAYNIVKGSGYLINDNTWNIRLMSSIN